MINNRFDLLEGLRCYLALWVVVSHAIDFTMLEPAGRFGSQHLHGGYAVQGFMILSGFVIGHLLLVKRESYVPYILRRFMRLAPIFIVCMALAWGTYGLLVSGVNALPWADDPSFSAFVGKWETRAALMADQPLAHGAAHLAMLHGAIPQQWLAQAPSTILAPGWSISLEWQFYLVAPLLLWLLQRVWGWPIVLGGVMFGIAFANSGIVGTFTEAFLGLSSKFLVLGMICRLILPALAKVQTSPWPPAIAMVVLLALWAEGPPGLLPWAFLFPFVVQSAQGGSSRIVSALFANRVVLAVGKLSYSIYLIHFVIQAVTVYLTVRVYPDVSQQELLAVLLASSLVAIAVSMLLYRFVEKPGIMLGHICARRWDNPAPHSVADAQAAGASSQAN